MEYLRALCSAVFFLSLLVLVLYALCVQAAEREREREREGGEPKLERVERAATKTDIERESERACVTSGAPWARSRSFGRQRRYFRVILMNDGEPHR